MIAHYDIKALEPVTLEVEEAILTMMDEAVKG